MHRFLWDLRYPPIPGVRPNYPIAAVYLNTAPAATSPWVQPGKYTVRLTANGRTVSQPLTVEMDPRIKTSASDLAAQFKLAKQLYDNLLALNAVGEGVRSLRTQLGGLRESAPAGGIKTGIDALNEKLQGLVGAQAAGGFGGGGGGGRGAGGGDRVTVASVSARARQLFGLVDGVDAAPTAQATVAIDEVLKEAHSMNEAWLAIKSQDVPALNQQLRAAGLTTIDTAKE
jgi:hypothetical protein